MKRALGTLYIDVYVCKVTAILQVKAYELNLQAICPIADEYVKIQHLFCFHKVISKRF